ncbi:hypothetical protein SGLAM104S_07011 [Streptomyces glaucescens]
MTVAPVTESMSALCASRVSSISTGTAFVVCGWFGCRSMRTDVIRSPSNVTSTCTSPFSVATVEPATTAEADGEDGEEEEEEDGGADADGVGAATVPSGDDEASWDGAYRQTGISPATVRTRTGSARFTVSPPAAQPARLKRSKWICVPGTPSSRRLRRTAAVMPGGPQR